MSWAHLATTQVGWTGVSSGSLSVTPQAGSDRLAIASLGWEDNNTGDTITALTWNSVALSTITSGSIEVGATFTNRTEQRYMLNANFPASAQNVAWTSSALINGGVILIVSQYSGVEQQANEAVGSASSTSAQTVSPNITTITNNAMVYMTGCQGNSGTWTWGTGQTERSDSAQDTMTAGASDENIATAGAQTQSGTVTGAANRIVGLVTAWKEVAAAGGGFIRVSLTGGTHEYRGGMYG